MKPMIPVTRTLLVATLCLAGLATLLGGSALAARRGSGFRASRFQTNSPAGVFALYQNPSFGYAVCLKNPDEDPDTILRRNGISTVNASAKEKAALAKGISQVNRLLGGPIPRDWRVNYQWKNGSGPWNSEISRSGFVTIKRAPGSPKGTLTGRMMHELGHKFGHANGAQNYRDYGRYTRGKRCHISTYSRKNLNEEFAEVFEAYVTHPEFLNKHCPDAFAFFQKQLFKNSSTALASCGTKEKRTADADTNRRSETATYDTAMSVSDPNEATEDSPEDAADEAPETDAILTG